MDQAGSRASAVLIRDGKVEYVGDDAHVIEDAATLGIPIMNAGGRTLLPGFVDAHTHFELTACSNEFWLHAHTPPHGSLESVAQSIREQLEQSTYPGWLVVRSSFGMHTKVQEERLFTRNELDEICPDRPLAIASGLHVMSLNTPALGQLGLLDADSTPQMVIHKDALGEPNGIVTEVWDKFPAFSADDVNRALRTQVGVIATQFGVTTMGSISYQLEDMEATAELATEGVPLRVLNYIHVPRVMSLEQLMATGINSLNRTTVSGLAGAKIFVDGQNGDGLDEVFHDFKWTQEELTSFVAKADGAGIQLMMHAVSPEAVRMALTAMESVDAAGKNPLRHRIEHGGDYLDVSDLERIRSAGAILITTPQFISSSQGEGTDVSAPLRTILDAKVLLAAGTDTTGTVPEGASPLYNIACAVNRAGPGQPSSPHEAITFEEALRLFTTSAAHSLFVDDEVGRIQPGFRGDLVLLDRAVEGIDGPSELFDVQIASVWFEGRLVHEYSGQAAV